MGKIINYSSVNKLLPEILNLDSWDLIDSTFRKTYNEMTSSFRLLAPKEEIKKLKP
ncbi:hypothetical protein GW796_06320 [archaeon]|nr:hypothetical protein [archaeon]